MWIQLGLAGGAAVVILILVARALLRRPHKIDVGPVSDAWLAEHRARGRETQH
jgi:hypothetical protein